MCGVRPHTFMNWRCVIRNVGIIGTAGRNTDFDRLTYTHFENMVRMTLSVIGPIGLMSNNIKLYSGGAAWADHVAVTLCNRGMTHPTNLTIFSPTDFNEGGFIGHSPGAIKTADTINYHHRRFSEKIKRDTFLDICDVTLGGATFVIGNGNFFERNLKIANSLFEEDLLIAFTFGDPSEPEFTKPWTPTEFSSETTAKIAGLKPGGTAHTWDNSKCKKIHVLMT